MAGQYGRRLRTLVRPRGMQRRTTYQKLLEIQARRLRRAIEADGDGYEPFLWK